MTQTLFFITSNVKKLEEARAYIEPLGYAVEQMKIDYAEIQSDTLENVVTFALDYIRERYAHIVRGKPFFIEDSGLFIDALNGFPGVYSAYVYRTIGYTGILKLLTHITDDTKRGATFKSCIGYCYRDQI